MYGSRFATTINFAPPRRVRATCSRRALFQPMERPSQIGAKGQDRAFRKTGRTSPARSRHYSVRGHRNCMGYNYSQTRCRAIWSNPETALTRSEMKRVPLDKYKRIIRRRLASPKRKANTEKGSAANSRRKRDARRGLSRENITGGSVRVTDFRYKWKTTYANCSVRNLVTLSTI